MLDDKLMGPRRAMVRTFLSGTLAISTVFAFPVLAQRTSDDTVKAAFLYNFAKFTEWPALLPEAPLVACVVGQDGIAAALTEMARARPVNSRRLLLGKAEQSAAWKACHILFIAEADVPRSADGLTAIKALPVLTVSDVRGFAQATGIIELSATNGQMQFVINLQAAQRSGLQLSSKLLTLGTVIGSPGPDPSTERKQNRDY